MRLILPALFALFSTACVDSYAERSAFDDLRFLCTEELTDEFDRQLAECSADQGCSGLISMQGRLQGIDITLESRIDEVEVLELRFSEDELAVNRVNLSARSPYFYFVLKTYTIGGDPRLAPFDKELIWDPAANHATTSRTNLEDDRVGGELRIQTALESVALGALSNSGTLKLSILSEYEYAGSFSAAFGAEEDRIDGCFHTFVSEIREEQQ